VYFVGLDSLMKFGSFMGGSDWSHGFRGLESAPPVKRLALR